MTLIEYITSLQDTGLSRDEIIAKTKEFKKTIGLEDTKVTEAPVEEVKTEVVVEKDATAATTPVASESLSSGSGESVSQEPRFFGPGMTDKEMDQARKSQKQYKDQTAKLNSVVKENETYSADNYDYKWEVSDDNKIKYYTKEQETDNWLDLSENNGSQDAQINLAAVQLELGHRDDITKEELQEARNQPIDLGVNQEEGALWETQTYAPPMSEYVGNVIEEDIEQSPELTYYTAQKNKLKEIEQQRIDLESKSTRFASNNFEDQASRDQFIAKELANFDENNAKEIELIKELDGLTDTQSKALEELRKDTGNNASTGGGFGDVTNYINSALKGFGVDFSEPSETIEINDEIELNIVNSLDKRSLQKLAKGTFNLQEKEDLINKFKIPVIKRKSKFLSSQFENVKLNYDEAITQLDSELDTIKSQMTALKESGLNTPEQVQNYNSLASTYTETSKIRNEKLSFYKRELSNIAATKSSIEGDLNMSFSRETLGNNFKLSDEVEAYRESFSGDGFWNGAMDIVGGEIVGGLYGLAKKASVGFPAAVMAGFGDLFTDEEEYSVYDAWRDTVYNFTDYSLVPKSEDEKFKITTEEGGFNTDAGARNYLKLGGQMLPFTLHLMNEVRKGNVTSFQKGIGKTITGLGSKSKVLSPVSSKLKDSILMADATFRATLMDNVKEAEAKGLFGGSGLAYASAVSLTEGLVQTIMPDAQFLRGVGGKKIKDIFSGKLKNIATKEGFKAAGKEFTVNILKELGEEEINAAMNIVTDASFGLALPKSSEFLNSQIELVAGTLMLSGGMGSIGAVKTFNNQKTLIYNQIHKNINSTMLYLDTMKKSSSNPETIAQIIKAQQLAFNVSKAMSKAPGDVTGVEVDLLMKKTELLKEKENVDSSFHGPINEKIAKVDEQIIEINKTKIAESKSRAGAKNISDQIESTLETFSDQAKIDERVKEIKEQGGSVLESTGYGQALVLDGKKIILINDQAQAEDFKYTTDQHELLHHFFLQTFQTNPDAAIKFGQALVNEIVNNPDITGGFNFMTRFNEYLVDENYSAENTWEEVIPLLSESLTDGDIVYNKKQDGFWKSIGKQISSLFKDPKNQQKLGITFDTGLDAFNFIKDFNDTIQSGGKLTEDQVRTAKEGAKGELVTGDVKIDGRKKGGKAVKTLNEAMVDNTAEVENIVAKESKKDTGVQASTKVQEIYDTQGEAGAFDIIDQFKPIVNRIVEKRRDAPNFDRQLLTDEIETGKRGIFDLIREYKPESGVPLAAYINKFLPARAIEASKRVLGEEFTSDVTEAKGVMAEEVTTEVAEKPVTRKIKPSSFISNEAVTKIKEQIQEKIKGIDPKNLTFKKLGDLSPEIIAAEIGIPVKKLTVATANLSKGDATAIQQFVNKNADKLLKILPEGAVIEAATDKLLGTSTGVPKGLLNAFYTKQARLGKGAGLAPFKLNKGISKADFLEAFGIVEGKKAEGFDARSPQAQALKGIASLYGKLVTNEIVRSDTDLSLEVKQDVAAGKNKAMASKRLLAEANIKPGLVDKFLKATSSKGFNDILEAKLKDKSVKQPWKSAATEYFKENPIEGLDLEARRQVISEISSVFSMKNEEVAVKRFSDRSFKELKNIIDESLASDLSKGYTFDTVDLITGDKTYRADERSLEGLNRIRVGVKILVDALAAKGFNKQQIETALYGGFITPANIGGFRVGKEPTSILLTAANLGEKTKTSRGSMAVNINDFRNNFLKGIPEGEKIKTKKETYSKDYWTNPKSKFNKLDQTGKLEFIQDLFNEGSKVKLQLADLVETISELDVAPEVTRYMITQLFADMSALGKRASGTRYVLTGVDGKMFSFKELEKLGLTRPDGDKGVFEHTKPANRVAVAAYAYARTGDAKAKQEFLNELETFDSALITEQMDDMLRNLKLQSKMGLDYKSTDNPMLTRYKEMVSDLSEQGVFFYDIKTKKQITPLEALSDGLVELEADDVQSIKEYKEEVEVKSELVPGKVMASKRDSDLIPDAIKYDRPISVKTAINALEKTDKALELARKLDQPVKKIRVFDFDDTLARTKSNVLYTMPDGTTGAIDAATFAKEAGNMEAEGAQWDFSEFSKVMQGSKGPLLDVAKIIADKRGTKDVFVLTARPADAAGPIKEFLASMGLDIPLANITGLGDGTPQAKAGWIMGKAAEGYNDFYFADDHTGNVKAVKDVLSQIDVKSKVQLAKASKRTTFDTVVNDMIEDSSGIETYKKYSAARAKTVGASKGKYAFLIPPSAEDFTGLLYKMIGKGKKGDAQMAFLKTNLLDTYNRAESAVTQAKVSAANDFVALKTKLKTLPKTLSKETGIGKFTYSHAVRVAAWTKQGMDIPGLSKRDVKELVDFVNKDAKLRVFTDELIKIQKGKEYPKPGKDWLGGNITTDIIGGINKVNRAEYQQEWRENIDIIFSEDNMNKMEAAYGSRWREAMEDSIRRMKSGSNRPIGGNRVTEGLLNWLNNSVGAVMFLNTRSALLQTISAVNFINLSDNNIVKAGVAFANQKQFWGDFMTLMNSDYLVERRNGLKINVSESEIADAVRESKNKPKAAIAFLLSKGFVMTRFADSFAIASGGSTFYRNRVNKYVKEGVEQSVAEKQAFADFKAIAEESQQSSSPSKISQQQASAAGRVILAWANTPMQYARIQKRAAQDLINGRGDWKTNVSKIVYYGAIQNLIFNSLQSAAFALGFGEDDEDDEVKAKKKEEKAYKIANGMIDSQLRGLGVFGTASVALKNTLMTLYEEHGKKGSKYENAVEDLLSFSPPLGSKIGKITGGLQSFSWNKKDMKEKGFSLDNPAYIAGAQVVTGLTNVPFDRVMKKINNVRGIVNERSALWQKVALGLGWSTWDVDLGYYGGFDKEKPLTPKQQLKLEVDTMKKETTKPDQVKTLLDFGLTKKQIRELKNENNRVKKILELQKKDKK